MPKEQAKSAEHVATYLFECGFTIDEYEQHIKAYATQEITSHLAIAAERANPDLKETL